LTFSLKKKNNLFLRLIKRFWTKTGDFV